MQNPPLVSQHHGLRHLRLHARYSLFRKNVDEDDRIPCSLGAGCCPPLPPPPPNAFFVFFLRQLRRWLISRVQSRKRARRRKLRRLAAVTMQSAARAASARARCSALRAARLYLWMDRVAVLYADDDAATATGIRTAGDDIDGLDYSPSPAAAELLWEMNAPQPPPPPPPHSLQPPLPSSPKYAVDDEVRTGGGGSGSGGISKSWSKGSSRSSRSSRGRALAEALAPRMGRPPPGCPAALDVDWGEWGVGLRLVFPPSPPPPRVL